MVEHSRPARGVPEGAIVLLHGRGTDENDLLPLADLLDPEQRLHVVTPRAPLTPAEIGEPGGPGAHWYALGGIPTPHAETFTSTFAVLGAWLDELPGRIGVPWERTVLGGFSQGAVMSYAMGLGAGRPSPAGLLPFSGFLPVVPGFELSLEDRPELPVVISHGTLDEVIPVGFGRQAAERLTRAGLDVVYRESPIGHGIDPGRLGELAGWVEQVVSRG